MTTLALSLLLAAISQVEATTPIRCAPEQVEQLRAQITSQHTVPGVIGLVRRTCR